MECKVRWLGDSTYLAETGSGHLIPMDVSPELGGRNLGARPMEMLLVGAGGCTSIDVVQILTKGRYEVTGCEVKLEAERATTEPKVFTRIHFTFVVTGRKLPREAVERAVKLSHDKYCSASVMLEKTAQIDYSIEIVEAA